MIHTTFFEPQRWVPKDDETPFSYWLSLSPVAPWFGIEWRFAAETETPVPVSKPSAVKEKTALNAVPRKTTAVKSEQGTAPKAVKAATPVKAPVQTKPEKPVSTPKPAARKAKKAATPDDLKLIKGIGPKLEKELNGLGIVSYKQIAELDQDNMDWIDATLTTFKGRAVRDDWVEQARGLLK